MIPTLAAKSSAELTAMLKSRFFLLSSDSLVFPRLAPSCDATKEILVRSKGSLYSLDTAY
eukprot:scaffold1351_cov176-Amphora_coffeaeformis.AAC.38